HFDQVRRAGNDFLDKLLREARRKWVKRHQWQCKPPSVGQTVNRQCPGVPDAEFPVRYGGKNEVELPRPPGLIDKMSSQGGDRRLPGRNNIRNQRTLQFELAGGKVGAEVPGAMPPWDGERAVDCSRQHRPLTGAEHDDAKFLCAFAAQGESVVFCEHHTAPLAAVRIMPYSSRAIRWMSSSDRT